MAFCSMQISAITYIFHISKDISIQTLRNHSYLIFFRLLRSQTPRSWMRADLKTPLSSRNLKICTKSDERNSKNVGVSIRPLATPCKSAPGHMNCRVLELRYTAPFIVRGPCLGPWSILRGNISPHPTPFGASILAPMALDSTRIRSALELLGTIETLGRSKVGFINPRMHRNSPS